MAPNDKILKDHPSKIGELVGIAFYDLISEKIQVEFNGQQYQFYLTKDHGGNRGVVASTLFHPPHHYLIKPWINYNISIGIDNFILYTNETITQDLLDIISEYDEKITLVEWDFIYYVDKFHGCQPQMLNHCLYTFKYDQVAFIDLDEFICMHAKYNNNIKNLINDHKQCDAIFMNCKWTQALTNSLNVQDILSSPVVKNKTLKLDEDRRVKNIIIRRENIREQMVHGANTTISRRHLPTDVAHFRHYMQLNSRGDGQQIHSTATFRQMIVEPENDGPLIR